MSFFATRMTRPLYIKFKQRKNKLFFCVNLGYISLLPSTYLYIDVICVFFSYTHDTPPRAQLEAEKKKLMHIFTYTHDTPPKTKLSDKKI